MAAGRTWKICTERLTFLGLCSPPSTNAYSMRSSTRSRTARDTAMPPGSASAWMRAASTKIRVPCALRSIVPRSAFPPLVTKSPKKPSGGRAVSDEDEVDVTAEIEEELEDLCLDGHI